MTYWNNWSGRHRWSPRQMHFAYSEEDVQALLASANEAGETLRVVGAGHSHADLIPGADHLVDIGALSGVVSIDSRRSTAWIWGGTPIHTLGPALHRHGLALHNQGDIDRQSIAGAVATGTHGTGVTLGNLSSGVMGLRLVCANGDVRVVTQDSEPDIWRAARLGLGAFGVVSQLELQLKPSYRLHERVSLVDHDKVVDGLMERTREHRHLEFFWYPKTDQAMLKIIDETDEPAQYPMADEGNRVGSSFEVLPNHRPHKHTEMEYSVPAADALACFAAIRTLLHTQFTDVNWPVEFRTLAADDVWLSTAFERETVTISVHQDINEPDEPYFRACEAIFQRYDGRPHWGKVHYLGAEQLADVHPRWNDWWHVRNQLDPSGTLLNPWLASIKP